MSNKADMTTGLQAVMKWPLLGSIFLPLSGDKGSKVSAVLHAISAFPAPHVSELSCATHQCPGAIEHVGHTFPHGHAAS